ncbi:condensation domain-containing protein [Micromonospora sp. S-DT3-3-22]|uniref:condensation domain-containing protein n=1 Tax=Micromonospora sp. S-DT3-3-22 TaxID=2755359 RepID=UPI00188E1448|nr:condensation domain-containing protein [Micromonospora sp. S-DT3-3-22]
MTDTSTSAGTLSLTFTGDGAGTGPLTWAQSVMWGPMQWFGKEANQFNIGRALVLPAPVAPDRLTAVLRHLVETYQTLRTRYVQRADGPRQEVAATGAYDVVLVDDQGDPARVGDDLVATLTEAAFEHEAQWPLRVGCARDRAGRITAVALVGSHLAFDGWAFTTLTDLLLDRLTGAAPAPDAAPPAGGVPQPLAQAAFQRSPAGQQTSRLGLRHWEQGLSAAPASMFDLPTAPIGDQPVERHLLDSTAVTAAATALATRTRTSFSTVLLGLTTLILTAYNGHRTAVFKLIAGNRLDRDSRDLIALNTLDALLVHRVDDDVDLLTVIRQLHRPAFDAYRRAQCDPAEVRRVVERVGRRRGVAFDLSAYFNNGHRGSDWATPDPDPGPDRLAVLRRDSRYSRLEPLSKSDMRFYVAASNLGDGRCRLGLLVDTAYLPGALGETVIRGIETLLCAAVTEEVRVAEIAGRIGLAPARRGTDWVSTPVGWVRPQAVADLVGEVAGGVSAAALVDPTGDGGVTVYVAGSASPQELHRRVLDALPGRPGVAAPTEYVICRSAPPAGAGPDAWRDMPVLARGPGRDA